MRNDDGVYYAPHCRDANGKTHYTFAHNAYLNRCSSKPIPSHYSSNQLNTHSSLGHAHQIQNSIFETQKNAMATLTLPCPYPPPQPNLLVLHEQTTTSLETWRRRRQQQHHHHHDDGGM